MSARPRYIVGIDLGTTNTAVAYVDTLSAEQRVTLFEVPQLVAPGEVGARRQLPSFVYLASEHDLTSAETAVPWPERDARVLARSRADEAWRDGAPRTVVGELARSQGARVSSRMIASSKSWLCHGGVDRQAPILPWAAEAVPKLSPIEASALVLAHVADAWQHAFPDAPLREQEVIVTVPASFDEAARELTLEAAAKAGLASIVLLEEPQAAFYAWVDTHPAGHRAKTLAPGSAVLVFDIGGGTTDFTLIAVGADGDSFERTAVGDHLLLGGDNIDLTLAKQVEQRLLQKRPTKLDPLQWHGLVHSCRLAKERLLTANEDAVTITVAGRGSRLIGGTITDAITRTELERTLFDGFFPLIAAGDLPQRTRGGLQEFGLPYAAEPAVTRHLASFLARHSVARVDAVLFNGGAMTPTAVRERVLAQLASWQDQTPLELANELPELAVAHGAAYYGLVRRGFGARIRGGTPRAFYVGVGAGDRGELAVCLAPKGLDDGSIVELERQFVLVTNRPVSFKLYSSSSRSDAAGALVAVGDGRADTIDDDSDLLELPPIVSVLRARGRAHVTVRLQVHISELGALEIWCHEVDGEEEHRWRLSFDMRAGGQGDDGALASVVDPGIDDATGLIRRAFATAPEELPQLAKAVEAALKAGRDDWSMATARAMFDCLMELEEARKKTPRHEQRWLNLAGFCLRPGTGAPLDQWRVKQMWRLFNEGVCHPKSDACRLAWWIVWRRVSGGLTRGQQEQLFDRLAQLFLPGKLQKKKWNELKPSKQEAAEMWRTLASLERLPTEHKMKLGDELIRRLETRKGREEPLHFWALGRIGARVPLYGPLNAVVPGQKAGQWLRAVLAVEWPDAERAAFPMAQLGRRTGDRGRDVDEAVRKALAERLRTLPGGERTARLVEEVIALDAREERVALGDTLPAGLRLAPPGEGELEPPDAADAEAAERARH